MKKTIASAFLISALTGCNHSINCDTPEVRDAEIKAINRYVGAPNNPTELRVESATQYSNKQTGQVFCKVNLSQLNFDDKREPASQGVVFILDVADDGENFTVTLTN